MCPNLKEVRFLIIGPSDETNITIRKVWTERILYLNSIGIQIVYDPVNQKNFEPGGVAKRITKSKNIQWWFCCSKDGMIPFVPILKVL